jgi:ATP-dependent RNA helicase TDRD9
MKKLKVKPHSEFSIASALLYFIHLWVHVLYTPVLQAGALLLESHGLPDMYDGDITFMGHVMAALPVDIHIAKMILLGHIFSVLEECIIMGE